MWALVRLQRNGRTCFGKESVSHPKSSASDRGLRDIKTNTFV